MSKKKTILFVDDEPSLQVALHAFLEDEGFECISTSNMTEAWEVLETTHVSSVVTDIMMPAGDAFPGIDSSETGYHFIEKLRKCFPNVAIVCLSVIGDQGKIRHLKKLGVLYLRKGETPLGTAVKTIKQKTTGIYEG
jgi:DNA-binding NarL/FixJ family response regulator